MTKTVIIGANHSGIAAANTLLDNYENQEVVILDRNSNLSYLGCGTALWVGRQIDSYDGLFYTQPEDFEKKGATVHMETVVDHVDFAKKEVYAKTLAGEELIESYDKLILATGSIPISPKIPGRELANIHFLKKFQDGQAVDQELGKDGVETVAVIGAGYIGVEIAEAARRRGKQVLLFDALDRALPNYYDRWFTDDMDKNLADNGIELHFGELAKEYKGTEKVEAIVTDKGEYPVDLVVNAIGFLPNNLIGKEHLELFVNGAYLVDRHQQTSDPDVYAIGDCATVYSNALQKTAYIALASNAIRSGLVAGHNVGGNKIESEGVQGSNGISIFGFNMVSTGVTVEAAAKFGLEVDYTELEDSYRPEFMRENEQVKIRIVFEKGSRRIVGAQLSSRADVSMAVHLFSLAIAQKVTIDEFKLLDIFFLPHFNKPYNFITSTALKAK
ncbi:MAG: H2O-forming NADH oxidase [Enterococcus sp.]